MSDKFHWLALLNTPSRNKKTLSFVLWISLWLLIHLVSGCLANVSGISFLRGLGSLFIYISGSPLGRKHCKIILANDTDSARWGGLDLEFDAGDRSGTLWVQYHLSIASQALFALSTVHDLSSKIYTGTLFPKQLSKLVTLCLFPATLISLSFSSFNTKPVSHLLLQRHVVIYLWILLTLIVSHKSVMNLLTSCPAPVFFRFWLYAYFLR